MRVRIDSRAGQHLTGIQSWIAEAAGMDTAARIIDDIVARCDTLADFPNRGTPRDNLYPGLRTIPHRRRFTICYLVTSEEVIVVGVVGAGQDLDVFFADISGG